MKRQSEPPNRKRATDELSRLRRENEALRAQLDQVQNVGLETVLNTLPVAVFLTRDADASQITCNQSAERLLRTPQGEDAPNGDAVGWVSDLFTAVQNGTTIPVTELPLQAAARSGSPVLNYKFDLVFQDGTVRSLTGNAVPLAQGGAIGAFLDVSDNKGAGRKPAELRESPRASAAADAERRRLFEVLETQPAMVCLLTRDYHVAFANRSFREKFGEADGRHCYEFCFGKSEPCEFCESFVPLQTGKPHHWELNSPDGSIIAAHDYPFTDVDGTPMILEMDMDITQMRQNEAELQGHRLHLEELVTERTALLQSEKEDRRAAEDALRASEALLRAVIDNATDAIYVKDMDSRWLMANPTVLRIVGRTAESALGKSDLDLYDNPAIGRAITENDAQVLSSGQPQAFEECVETPEGRRLFLSMKAPRRNADGSIIGLVGISRDITEQKRAEQALRDSEAGYRALFENMLDGFAFCRMLYDQHGQPEDFIYLTVNESFDRLTGLRNVVGKRVTEVVPGIRESNPEIFEIYGRVSETGTPERFEVDFKPLSLFLSVSVYSPAKGFFVAVFDDITERKRSEEALRKWNAELEHRVAERTAELVQAGEQVQAERQRFLDMLDTMPVILTIIREDHRIDWANRAYREALGDNKGLLCHASQFGRETPCEECQAFIPLQTGQPQHWEWTLPNGRTFDIHNFPFTAEDGSPAILEMDLDVTEQRQAEAALKDMNATLERLVAERTAALRESEERYRGVVENTTAVILRVSPAGVITYANNRALDFFGYTAEELVGRHAVGTIIPAADSSGRDLAAMLEGIAANPEQYHTNANENIRKDGKRVWLEWTNSGVYGPDGRMLEFLSVGIDATERKQAENALRESEESLRRINEELDRRVQDRTAELTRSLTELASERQRFHHALDQLPAYLILISPDYRVPYANRFFEERFGRSEGRCCYDYLFHRTEPCENCETFKVLQTGGPHRWEWTGPDGRTYDIYDFPFTDADGAQLIMEVGVDITEVKLAQTRLSKANTALRQLVDQRTQALTALRESQKMLSEAQRIAHLGSWEWDLVSDEMNCSDEVFRIFGHAPQTFLPSSADFLEQVHPDDRERMADLLQRIRETGERFSENYRIIRLDGTEVFVHGQGESATMRAGRPVRMLGSIMDVTEQMRLQEEARVRDQHLAHTERMVSLGVLVSGVAHEINNPNHSIMSNVGVFKQLWPGIETILDKFCGDFGAFALGGFEYPECRPRLAGMLEAALAGSERIRVIVDELRNFARSNPKELMSNADINAILRSATVLVADMVRKATDRFVIDYGPGLPFIFANSQRIEQVLINLIQNACRALDSRDKGIRVTTSHSVETNEVLVEVRDEGVGIPEENLRHLGDPFFTTRRSAGGTGLGLWVSFNIVHEHGGKLTFVSRPGEGTCALLALPAAPQPPGENVGVH